jgi:hypothetical protein
VAKRKLRLYSNYAPDVELQSIDATHLETLRRLKNAHRGRFFFQLEISPEQQRVWFDGYLTRSDDWMFVIVHEQAVVGCVGFRVVDHAIDLYNLLREDSIDRSLDVPGRAFDMMCAYAAATYALPIRGRVLADNPAINWFLRRGFEIRGQAAENGVRYYAIELPPVGLIGCDVVAASG